MQQDTSPLQAAKDKLFHLISRRDHSKAELDRKLRQKGFDRQVVAAVLEWALQEGYLNEEKFAEAYSSELARKGYGPMMIRKKIGEKGLRGASEHIEPDSAEDIEARARELIGRRYGLPAEMDPATKLKAARFLASRGYSHAVMRSILGPLPRQA